jgi:outer membrane lipopolysaccharide assembly protein LptE/RlpB
LKKLAKTREEDMLEVDMKVVLIVFVVARIIILGGSDLLIRQDCGAQEM